jgi:hypothetical protein
MVDVHAQATPDQSLGDRVATPRPLFGFERLMEGLLSVSGR